VPYSAASEKVEMRRKYTQLMTTYAEIGARGYSRTQSPTCLFPCPTEWGQNKTSIEGAVDAKKAMTVCQECQGHLISSGNTIARDLRVITTELKGSWEVWI